MLSRPRKRTRIRSRGHTVIVVSWHYETTNNTADFVDGNISSLVVVRSWQGCDAERHGGEGQSV